MYRNLVLGILGCLIFPARGEGRLELDFNDRGWELDPAHNTFRKPGQAGFPTVEQGEWRPPAFRVADGIRHVEFAVKASAAPKDRVETKLLSDIPAGVTRYSSFSVRIPAVFPQVPADGWLLFHQWHQSSPESPPLAFEIKPGTNDVLALSLRFTGDDGKEQRRLKHLPLTLGKWLDFVVRWRFEPRSEDGEAVVWLEGKEVFRYRGRLGFSQVEDQFVDEKFGIYRKGARDPAAIEYRRLRAGTAWNEVAQGSEQIPPSPQ